MEQKAFTIINRGMNRDLSVSKVGESAAYENRNIRITVGEDNTLLSVTNERGTKFADIEFIESENEIIVGWNILNEHIIVFTHSWIEEEPDKIVNSDRIYRVDYYNGSLEKHLLFVGDLNFSDENPIESVVDFETDDVKKIYWVDGRNVLRFMNFVAKQREVVKTVDGVDETYYYYPWQDDNGVYDTTYFDSNRSAEFDVNVEISKDHSGNARANGVVQYLITYYNEHGQETNYVWISDLVYLAPFNNGGPADGQNHNRVTLTITNLDTKFDHFRVYSVFRSTLDGQTISYLVFEGETSESVIVVDDGAHLTLQDSDRLLYLGSKLVKAGTITYKDQTLFLGDLRSIGRGNIYQQLSDFTKTFYNPSTGLSNRVTFIQSSSDDSKACDIPYADDSSIYPYNNQLKLTSSQILTFKGGEKYRFALQFQMNDGTDTDAFWIGDAVNNFYPVINNNPASEPSITRAVGLCTLTNEEVKTLVSLGIKTVKIMIAEATDADRAIKAQGFVNPTMFNVWERFNNRVYAVPSWITRARNAEIANHHFRPVNSSTSDTAEIECNYWPVGSEIPTPYYRYKNTSSSDKSYLYDYSNGDGVIYNNHMIICYLGVVKTYPFTFMGAIAIIEASGSTTVLNNLRFSYDMFGKGDTITGDDYTLKIITSQSYTELFWSWQDGVEFIKTKFNLFLNDNGFYNNNYSFDSETLGDMYHYVNGSLFERQWAFFNKAIGTSPLVHITSGGATPADVDAIIEMTGVKVPPTGDDANRLWTVVANGCDEGGELSQTRWYDSEMIESRSGEPGFTPAMYTKHLMFIDENLVTFNSPELSYGSQTLADDLHFRIVGVARLTSNMSDYDVSISNPGLAGENLYNKNFNSTEINGKISGLTAWPLWRERGLRIKESRKNVEVRKRVVSDFDGYSDTLGFYWLYMWGRAGFVTGYYGDAEKGEDYSVMNYKIFANKHICYDTIYSSSPVDYPELETLKVVDKVPNQYLNILVGDEWKYYNGNPDLSLSCPQNIKYPIRFYHGVPNSDSLEQDENSFLFTNEPVNISYRSDRHAIIGLPTSHGELTYSQTLLPYVFSSDKVENYIHTPSEEWGDPQEILDADISDAFLPWNESKTYNLVIFDFTQSSYDGGVDVDFNLDSFDPDRMVISASTGYILRIALVNTAVWAILRCVRNVYENQSVFGYIRAKESDDENADIYEYLVDLSTLSLYRRPRDIMMYYKVIISNAKVLHYHKVGDTPTPEEDEQQIIADYLKIIGRGEEPDEYEYEKLGLKYVNPFSHSILGDASSYEIKYEFEQEKLNGINGLKSSDPYILIGELYQTYDEGEDKRYGGISESAILNNRFIIAGPSYALSSVEDGENLPMIANQGDTYFQRWDCLKTLPASRDNVNSAIDITSVMLETHINLDGRTDNQRNNDKIASLDETTFGQLNDVYSQKNNFKVARDLDDDYNTDAYRSSITWTLPKADLSYVDEWSHITLANSLKLDGDKGIVRALRRFQNSIIAFQDRGISEILFNSRTQLTTQDGTPVEIANSGKVDGKKYITNKYGCINKWSIVEGKQALYFVDNINKAFCSLSGGIENLSIKLGFSSWFKRNNKMNEWTPKDNGNFLSFYDRVNSDVYLFAPSDESTEEPRCLVYNETIDSFTSFFDYSDVMMLVNVEDKLISYYDNKLWFQNEGLFGDFFGNTYPFSMTFRVTPNPYTDKIWTNIDYRADFYRVLDEFGDRDIAYDSEKMIIDAGDIYQPNETFDSLKVSNEYQRTSEFGGTPDTKKKFRIWRCIIPRAMRDGKNNKFGLDRIRNPWVNIEMKKNYNSSEESRDLMQLHDVTIRYFE